MKTFNKKKLITCFLFLLIGQIKSELYAKPYEYVQRQDEIYLNEISANFIREVEKEFGLSLNAFGASMPDKIEAINLRFEYDKAVTIQEARWLLINLRKKLVSRVNENEKIRPFLAEYPFTPARANISLCFPKVSKIEKVDFVHVGKNKIFYCKYNQKKQSYDHLLVESLDDAIKEYNLLKMPSIFKTSAI